MVRQLPAQPNADFEARSFLFVPANRVDWLDKALASEAEAIVADLEDGVAAADKDDARLLLADWMSKHDTRRVFVRVNNTPERLGPDLEAISKRAVGILFPKAVSPDAFDEFEAPVIAMIESGAGWLNASQLASHASVVRLAAGEQDLLADLGIQPSEDERELLPFRMHLFAASAAAASPPPIGPVHMQVRDIEGVRRSSELLRRMGFGGRSAIHPEQVAAINESFAPRPDELQWAQEIVALNESSIVGAFTDADGNLVDEAVVARARRLLARYPGRTEGAASAEPEDRAGL